MNVFNNEIITLPIFWKNQLFMPKETALAVAGCQPWVLTHGHSDDGTAAVGENPHESRSDDGIPDVGGVDAKGVHVTHGNRATST